MVGILLKEVLKQGAKRFGKKKITDKDKVKDLVGKGQTVGRDIAKQSTYADVLKKVRGEFPEVGRDIVKKMYGGKVKKKMYGGKVKKMKAGGKLKMVNRNGEDVPFFVGDGVGKAAGGGMVKYPMKMKNGGVLEDIRMSPQASMITDRLKRMANVDESAPVEMGMRRQKPQKGIV